MPYRDWSESRKRQVRYGAAALLLAVVAAASLLWQAGSDRIAKQAATPATISERVPETRSSNPDDPDLPNPKADLALQAVADARRLADDGNFAQAEAELKKAEQAMPDMPQIKQARDDIAAMQTPQGQLRLQLNKAELAIERNDEGTARAALAKAAEIAPDSPDIGPLQQRLQELQQRTLAHANRLAELLTRMREAIARQDFATADDALNLAERLDVGNPAVMEARIELNRAHNAVLRKEENKPAPSLQAPR